MKTTMKRFATLTTIGALAASMMAPAFAAAPTTTITAKYAEIPIDVVVTAKMNAQINPYGLPVKVGATDANKVTVSGLKVVSDPGSIVNISEVNLDVGASVTGTVAGNLKLQPAGDGGAMGNIATDATTNTASIILEAITATEGDAAITDEKGVISEEDLNNQFKTDGGWANTISDGSVSGSAYITVGTKASDVVVGNDADETGKVLMTLKGLDTSGDDPAVQKGQVGIFRLNGDVVQNPKTAWAKTDGVTVAVAWTFTPNVTPAAG